jgi:hypothetical protein
MDCGFGGEEEEKDGGAGGVNAQKVHTFITHLGIPSGTYQIYILLGGERHVI